MAVSKKISRIRWAAVLAALAIGLGLDLTGAREALAHAYLVQSEPAAGTVLDAAPSQLRLGFSEQPEARFSDIRLLDTSGQPAGELGPLQADPADPSVLRVSVQGLSPEVYTVAWKVLSSYDGHITSGAFAFVIGQDNAPAGGATALGPTDPFAASEPTPLAIGSHWLGYIGVSILIGTIVFLLLVLKPLRDRATATTGDSRSTATYGTAVATSAQPAEQQPFTPGRPFLLLLAAGWAITLLATSLAAWDQTATVFGLSYRDAAGSPLWGLLNDTRYGAISMARMGLLEVVVAAAIVGLQYRQYQAVAALSWWTALAFALIVLFTYSLESHAAASGPPLAVLVDWLHLTAATVWAGGLACLALFVALRMRSATGKATYSTAQAVAAFSTVATVCVGVIVVSGPLRAASGLSNWEDLFDTVYGNAILAKVGLLVPILAFAAANRFPVRWRLQRQGGAPGSSDARAGLRLILGTTGGEILLVSAVLLATSILTGLPTPEDTFGSSLVMRSDSGGLRSVVVITPGKVGINNFDIQLRDEFFQPVSGAQKVALIFGSEDLKVGKTEAVAADIGDGHYRLQGSYLSVIGTWNVELLVRLPGKEDVRLHFTVQPSQLADSSA